MNKTNRFTALLLGLLSSSGMAVAQQKAKPASTTPPVTAVTPAEQVSPTAPVLVEKVDKKEGEVVIPYSKWRLPNGLTIYLSEDHSDPMVYVNVTYKVGSDREVPGRTGFAHFFEHNLFQGSEHVADEEHIHSVERFGGVVNGNTSNDRTIYFETVPSNYLEEMLWLESDRMGFLLDSVTQHKFEVQRDAVKNEKEQNLNRPYARLPELMGQTLYPPGHPYNWPIIGYMNDLNAANVDDLKNFFKRWYGPNNAILTITGDFDSQQALKWIEKYFATINRGPEVKKLRVDPVYLPADRYVSYTDRLPYPVTVFVYPTVKNYDPDEPALDILSTILGDGNNSFFYQHFDKMERVVNANVGHPCRELAGEFQIQLALIPGTPKDSVDFWLKETFDDFEKTGISDEAMQRAKAKYEATLIGDLDNISDRGEQLATWDYLLGRTWNVGDELKRYNRVTKEDVMRVYNKYIKNKSKVVASAIPLMPGQPEQKFNEPVTEVAPGAMKEYEGLVYKKPVDNFDRSVRPQPGPGKPIALPKYYTANFDNGLKVIGTTNNETPRVTLLIEIKGGHLLDALPKSGTAQLTAALMNESTKNFSSEAISAQLEKLGSSISFGAGDRGSYVEVNTLKKNLDATLKVLEEKLMNPAFDAADFKRIRKQQIDQVRYLNSLPQNMAQNAMGKLLFGDNVYGTPASGTDKTLKSVELKDVVDYYSKYYSPSVSRVTIVGDVTEAEIIGKLGFLKNWAAKPVTIPAPPAPANIESNQVYIVDKPGAPQSFIIMGHMAMPYDYNGDFYRARLTNYMLGEAFNSRINLKLREELGFSYGAGSFFSGNKDYGTFNILGSFRTNVTDSSLRELFNQVRAYRNNGITETDLADTRSSFSQREALKYEAAGQKARFLGSILEYNLPADFVTKQASTLNKITREEMTNIAQMYINPDKMIIVVVGDKEKIKKKLVALNLGKVSDY